MGETVKPGKSTNVGRRLVNFHNKKNRKITLISRHFIHYSS